MRSNRTEIEARDCALRLQLMVMHVTVIQRFELRLQEVSSLTQSQVVRDGTISDER